MRNSWRRLSAALLLSVLVAVLPAPAGAQAPAPGSTEEVLPDGSKAKITRLRSGDLAPESAGARPAPTLAPAPAVRPTTSPLGARPAPPAVAAPRPAVPRAAPRASAEVAAPAPRSGEQGGAGGPEASGEAPRMDVATYARLLKQRATALKATVLEKVSQKLKAKQAARMETVADVLGWISLGGLLLLLTPLFLRRRYPGQLGQMFKVSLLAAGTFFLAILLFTAVLMLLRTVQAEVGNQTNPQVAVIGAVFDNVLKYHKEFAELGPAFIEPFLKRSEQGTESPLLGFVAHLAEIQQLVRKDVAVFKTVASWVRAVNWIFAYVPVVLVLVAVLLFLLSIKDVLVDIVSLPARAAAGQLSGARSVISDVLRKVGRELLVTLGLIMGIVVLSLLSGLLLSRAVVPAVDAFLTYLFSALFYLITDKNASTTWIYVSLGGTLLFVVVNVAVILLGYTFFLGKLQKILKLRFHEQVPLRRHGAFWGWGSLSLLWIMALPWLYILAVRPFVEALIDRFTHTNPPSWVPLLVSGPAVLLCGFLVVFWAARGLRGMTFLLRYDPKARAEPQAAEAAEMVEAGARLG